MSEEQSKPMPTFAFLFPQQEARLLKGQCPLCGCNEPAATIKDDLSRKEYHTSGMCQNCQDQMFKEV